MTSPVHVSGAVSVLRPLGIRNAASRDCFQCDGDAQSQKALLVAVTVT